jgi:hypothetical protein
MDRDGKKKLPPLFLSCIGSRLIFSVGWGHVRYMASTSPIFHSSSSSAGVDIRIGMCTVPDTQRTQVQPVGKNNTCPYIMSQGRTKICLWQKRRHDGAKRRKTTSSKPGRQWAELPVDVLLSVAYAASYPSASLHAAVGHVCTRWRAAIASNRAFPGSLPLLALQELPPTSRRGYMTGLPEEWRDRVRYGVPRVVESDTRGAVGSCHGWLIVLDPDAAHLSLRNPATGHAIHLPSLRPLISSPSVDVHRVIISHDPALHKDFVVLLFLAGITTRCFTFRGGANAWAAHAHREFHVEDVLFFSGRFVAVDKQNNLGVFEWRDKDDDGGDHLAMKTRRIQPRMHDPRRILLWVRVLGRPER